MKIQYCSDLHLEFPENKKFLKQNLLKPEGDILVLAGDIVPFAIMDKHSDFFDYVSDNFGQTYWIPGNHEYYYFDASKKCGSFHEKIKSNVSLLNNAVVIHDDVKIILSTLWSKISPANEWYIERNMSDFQVIKYNGKPFSSFQFNQFHQEALNFIKDEAIKEHLGKTIVATHHVPTLLNYPEKYKADSLNEGFAVELFDFIEASSVDFWIYGHHHANTPDFKIGATQLLTNQLGYVSHDEHSLFNNAKIINL